MATQTHSPFETLARVIEHLDDDGRSVRRTEAAGSGKGGSLRATVDVSVDLPSEGVAGLGLADATVDDGLRVTFRAPAFPDPAEALPPEFPRVSAVPDEVWLDAGSVVVRLAVTIGDPDPDPDPAEAVDAAGEGEDRSEAATGASGPDADPAGTGSNVGDAGADEGDADADADGSSPLSAVRDGSVPAYDDTPYLRRLYETSGTFAEMSDRIDMDVSAETVRRYMTEAGVHSPTSYETAGTGGSSGGGAADADAEPDPDPEPEPAADPDPEPGEEPAGSGDRERSPVDVDVDGDTDADPTAALPDEQLVADGIGLPETLTLRDLVDAVVGARTVHEVQREIGLGYDRTRQLLVQLNVLDLVVGRVSGEPDRAVTVDVVADRIRQCAPDAA